MKLVVLGFGQCGSNIADEFYAVNSFAKSVFHRKIEIVTDTFAINTDETDLGGFRHIPKDKCHRVLVGAMSTFGHGVGKINTEAAKIIKNSHSLVVDTVLSSRKFHESDAVICIASGGGGTGSGTIGWIVKELKERVSKPIYGMVVFPFAFEERGDTSYAVTNTASCVNTVLKHADAVFLIDNERYRKSGLSLAKNFREINKEIVLSFYDLLCAGEEKNVKFVGSKVMDAGDIKQSLASLTVIGRGEVRLPMFRRSKRFREGVLESSAVLSALRQAENTLSMKADLADARKMLVMIGAPKSAISTTTMEEITRYLEERSPKAILRIGDYPRRKNIVSVTLIASQLTKVPKLESMFLQAETMFAKHKDIEKEAEFKIEQIIQAGRNIPTLD